MYIDTVVAVAYTRSNEGISSMMTTTGDKKRLQNKGAVKTHKRAVQEGAEENLNRKKDRLREEGSFSPKAEEEKVKNKQATAQKDIGSRVTMPPTVHSWKRNMMRRVSEKI
jgi:ribosome assembly protein YihI (activator of Der GTPase)